MSRSSIRIERRGHFDDDEFFKDSWNEWDSAMKDAIDRWETKTNRRFSKQTSTLPRHEAQNIYRNIRSTNVTSDDSQAVSCTEEDSRYKIVLDVRDFNLENLNVKAIDEKLHVEGLIETREGNTITKNHFTRKFLLPSGVNTNQITSALSKDGVLTINIPKMLTYDRVSRNSSAPTAAKTTTKPTDTTRYYVPIPRGVKIIRNYPAGKPTDTDYGPFNPTGGGNVTTFTSPDGNKTLTQTLYNAAPVKGSRPRYYTTPVRDEEPVNSGSRTNERGKILTCTGNDDKWKSLDTRVKCNDEEIERMMRRHNIDENLNTRIFTRAVPHTDSELQRKENTVTEREEKTWRDSPAPGVNRSSESRNEMTEERDSRGNLIGYRRKNELKSNSEGIVQEDLDDGSKRKTFTKNYESKNYYKSANHKNW